MKNEFLNIMNTNQTNKKENETILKDQLTEVNKKIESTEVKSIIGDIEKSFTKNLRENINQKKQNFG
ncbi:MAG: hypothetical protein ABIP51_06310 [Bacteroidia bacterium]